MASSLQTLVKILELEENKGYQNKAVIGGFARFAYHWAREAHAHARTDTHHALVDEIAKHLRDYESTPEDQRPAALEALIALATGESLKAGEETISQPPPEQGEQADLAEHGPTHGEDTVVEAEAGPEPEADGATLLPDELETDLGPAAEEPVAEELPSPSAVRERRGYARLQQSLPDPDILRHLEQPVSQVSGIGPKRQEQFERLGIRTVGDLLLHFPRRYDDYSQMKIVNQLRPGEEVTVLGFLERIKAVRMKNGGTRVEAYLADDSGSIRLNWFNQPWMEQQLEAGEPVVVSGKIDQYLGRLVINTPELEPIDRDWLHTGRIVPVYPLTEGLSARMMRRLVKDVIDEWAPRLPDPLPLSLREDADLMDYGDAVAQAHFPDSQADKKAALQRLAFDELFFLHFAMLRQRYLWQSRAGTPLLVDDEWLEALEAGLPYQLTGAQQRAIAEIRHDLGQDVPMTRLLQGDVGSGKTVVAATAIGIAAANGVQAVLMAPTNLLAEQHYRRLDALMQSSPVSDSVNVALLTGKISQGERDEVYAGLASGEIQVAVGTHALIQPGVEFARLGLAVVDEQHRFGVLQRSAIRDKAGDLTPHLLVMTATPIPRTLALTVHADLDLTIIDEMPPGRQPTETRILQMKERERAYSFIRGQIEQGHQAYIICPLIEDSEKLDARSAVAEYERLKDTVFPDLSLGLMHGRMSSDEKEDVMSRFYAGEIAILVSTTVIEVGIDVPNATVMMIENANRFGLAQLHQLRGRVGRGESGGYCLLLSDRPFLDTDPRLQAVEETNDGFRLAQIDWEMRGPGDLLGTQQSGFASTTHFVDLIDTELIYLVQREAQTIFEHDPELTLPEHRLLAERINERWQNDAAGIN
jgi:ATP-dependent DNA helicase RecG